MVNLEALSELNIGLPVLESGLGNSNPIPFNSSTDLGIILKPKGNLGAQKLSIEELNLEASDLLKFQPAGFNNGHRNPSSNIPSHVQLPWQESRSLPNSSPAVEKGNKKDDLTGQTAETTIVGTSNQSQDINTFQESYSLNNYSESEEVIKDPLLGIYYGNQGWDMNSVKALETWQGKKHAVLNLFTNWVDDSQVINNLFQQQLPNIWNNQNIPMITWEPYVAGSTPNDIEVRIGNGQYDSYIHNWADQLKTFLSGSDGVYGTADDRRAYLRFAHEMNGDWYPWSSAMGNNTPEQYVQMWQHTKDIFDAKGMDNTRLQWVWNVNNVDIGGYKAEAFYPGDNYVDWVAIDGYNWGATQSWSTWQTPAEVFGPMIDRLKAMTDRPIGITEVGTTSLISPRQNDVAAKSAWISNFLDYAVQNDVKMVVWFNEDKETDWAVFGGGRGDVSFKQGKKTYRAYSSYKTGITPISYSGSDPTNPRLLTDEFFMGLMA